MPDQVPGIWLGEARANLHAAVQAMEDPPRRRAHAVRAWAYAMQVLVFEDHAQGSELDRACAFAAEAAGHIDGAAADPGQRPSLG